MGVLLPKTVVGHSNLLLGFGVYFSVGTDVELKSGDSRVSTWG